MELRSYDVSFSPCSPLLLLVDRLRRRWPAVGVAGGLPASSRRRVDLELQVMHLIASTKVQHLHCGSRMFGGKKIFFFALFSRTS